jgi:hypothetical protein
MGSKRKRHQGKLQKAGLTSDNIQSTLYDKTTEYGEVYGRLLGMNGVILEVQLGVPAPFPEEDHRALLSEFHGLVHTFIDQQQYGWRHCSCEAEPFTLRYKLYASKLIMQRG